MDAKPEGVSRRRARDLVGICFDHAFVPQYYMSHVARGKWQDELVRQLREKLTFKKYAGKAALLTIDMKSKTSTGKTGKSKGMAWELTGCHFKVECWRCR